MKYTLAKDPQAHNCSDSKGHGYELIHDRGEIKRIRLQHPQLQSALWRCSKCGKVKESM